MPNEARTRLRGFELELVRAIYALKHEMDEPLRDMKTSRTPSTLEGPGWRALPYGLAILGILLTIGLSLTLQRPSQVQYFVLRVVLALAGAGAAAVIPGLLRVELSRGIRAGGALAVFVVIYFANPPSPPLAETASPQRLKQARDVDSAPVSSGERSQQEDVTQAPSE